MEATFGSTRCADVVLIVFYAALVFCVTGKLCELGFHQQNIFSPNAPRKWIITDRGYANIVPSPGDLVYGLVFDLSKSDEDTLDVYENVPIAYEKEYKAVEFGPLDTKSSSALEEVLIYIDHIRVTENKPKHEYIHRINRGIEDGIKHGVPESYFEKYFRSFIPADSANNAP
jgi:gamma-glutamylcyclotransferase